MLLNLNPVMSIIANVPAAIASTIVACRAVRRLTRYTSGGGAEMFGSTTQGTTLAFRSGAPSRPNLNTKVSTAGIQAGGVHVQMETFESPSDKSYMEYDAAGKIIKGDNFDPETQVISSEFKRPPY